jgi:hypothetical protein
MIVTPDNVSLKLRGKSEKSIIVYGISYKVKKYLFKRKINKIELWEKFKKSIVLL